MLQKFSQSFQRMYSGKSGNWSANPALILIGKIAMETPSKIVSTFNPIQLSIHSHRVILIVQQLSHGESCATHSFPELHRGSVNYH